MGGVYAVAKKPVVCSLDRLSFVVDQKDGRALPTHLHGVPRGDVGPEDMPLVGTVGVDEEVGQGRAALSLWCGWLRLSERGEGGYACHLSLCMDGWVKLIGGRGSPCLPALPG